MKSVRLGPFALLLTVITICLTVLSVLSLTTARADLKMAERTGKTVAARYQLEIRGQEYLKEARDSYRSTGTIPLAEPDEKGIYSVDLSEDNRTLHIGFQPMADDLILMYWKIETGWNSTEDLNLWSGL